MRDMFAAMICFVFGCFMFSEALNFWKTKRSFYAIAGAACAAFLWAVSGMTVVYVVKVLCNVR